MAPTLAELFGLTIAGLMEQAGRSPAGGAVKPGATEEREPIRLADGEAVIGRHGQLYHVTFKPDGAEVTDITDTITD